jgi:hypothetical protein
MGGGFRRESQAYKILELNKNIGILLFLIYIVWLKDNKIRSYNL